MKHMENMSVFKKLIEEKESEILDVAEIAYGKAVRDTYEKYNIELFKDGSIEAWKDHAGGRNQHLSALEEDSIVLFSICFENGTDDIEISDEILEEVLRSEKGYTDEKIDQLYEEASSCRCRLETLIKNEYPELESIISKCYEKEIQIDIDNNARDFCQKKLDAAYSQIKDQIGEEKTINRYSRTQGQSR